MGDTTLAVQPKPVHFTDQQIAYLDKMFPEVIGNDTTLPAQFYVQAGKRAVVELVRSRRQRNDGGS